MKYFLFFKNLASYIRFIKNGNRVMYNHCSFLQKIRFIFRVNIWSNGYGNKIQLGNNCTFNKSNFLFIGNGNRIKIASGFSDSGESVLRCDGDENYICLGKNIRCNKTFIHSSYKTSITVGNDCVLSHDVHIRTGDHKIFSLESNKMYPFKANIFIGNHVFIGKNVTILKGTKIRSGSVVGAGSIVSGNFFNGSNLCIVGIPAKIVHTDIIWET